MTVVDGYFDAFARRDVSVVRQVALLPAGGSAAEQRLVAAFNAKTRRPGHAGAPTGDVRAQLERAASA